MRIKDGTDVAIDKVTKDNYIVKSDETNLFHVKIELVQYHSKTGVKMSRPRIQKYGIKVWTSNLKSNLKKQGYTLEVLHDPIQWASTNAALLAEKKAAEEARAKEAAEKKAEAERDAMKAEILAELKAAGLIPATEPKTETEPTTEAETEAETEPKKPGRPAKK